jgi:hypothetical protein
MKERMRAPEQYLSLRQTHPQVAEFIAFRQYRLLELRALVDEGCELYPEEQNLHDTWQMVSEVVGDAADTFLTDPTFETPQQAVNWVHCHFSVIGEANRKRQKICKQPTTASPGHENALSLNEEAILCTARAARSKIGSEGYRSLLT